MANFSCKVAVFESNTPTGLDSMLEEFLEKDDLEVVNVSITSCYHPEEKDMVFALALAYRSNK